MAATPILTVLYYDISRSWSNPSLPTYRESVIPVRRESVDKIGVKCPLSRMLNDPCKVQPNLNPTAERQCFISVYINCIFVIVRRNNNLYEYIIGTTVLSNRYFNKNIPIFQPIILSSLC